MAKKKATKTKANPDTKQTDVIFTIPVERIVRIEDNRYPLSDALRELGFGVLGVFPPGAEDNRENSEMFDLWRLATGDDPDDRANFAKIIDQYDPEMPQLAASLLAQGQLQAIGVKEIRSTPVTYELVFGMRRCLAALYNHCAGSARYARIQVRIVKANERNISIQRLIENMLRKRMTISEEAEAFQRLKNAGMTNDEIAGQSGVSAATVRNRLKFFSLDEAVKAKVDAGELSPSEAVDQSRKKRKKAESNGSSNGDSDDYALMPRRKIVEWYESEDCKKTEKKVLAKILGVVDEDEE